MLLHYVEMRGYRTRDISDEAVEIQFVYRTLFKESEHAVHTAFLLSLFDDASRAVGVNAKAKRITTLIP